MTKLVIPQKNPLISAFVKTTPDIPEIGEFISENPKNWIIRSPGGIVGFMVVIPKRQTKQIIIIAIPNISMNLIEKINLILV